MRSTPRPPSIGITAPDIQPPCSSSSKIRAIAAKSSGWPKRGSACAWAIPFAKTAFPVKNSAIFVSDKDGAIALEGTDS